VFFDDFGFWVGDGFKNLKMGGGGGWIFVKNVMGWGCPYCFYVKNAGAGDFMR